MRRGFLRAALVLLALALAAPAVADGTIYKWVDKQGNVHYTDCPPPPGCEAETVEAAAAPDASEVAEAERRLEEMLAEQARASEAREKERLDREGRQVEAMRIAVTRKERCIEARQNLHVLEMQVPVYTIDEKGERVFLDDPARKAAIEAMRKQVAENCESK
jgi:hypothetical protein